MHEETFREGLSLLFPTSKVVAAAAHNAPPGDPVDEWRFLAAFMVDGTELWEREALVGLWEWLRDLVVKLLRLLNNAD